MIMCYIFFLSLLGIHPRQNLFEVIIRQAHPEGITYKVQNMIKTPSAIAIAILYLTKKIHGPVAIILYVSTMKLR